MKTAENLKCLQLQTTCTVGNSSPDYGVMLLGITETQSVQFSFYLIVAIGGAFCIIPSLIVYYVEQTWFPSLSDVVRQMSCAGRLGSENITPDYPLNDCDGINVDVEMECEIR